MVQVAPEPPALHFAGQIAQRERHHPHVDGGLTPAAHPAQPPGLQHPQQLGLQLQGQLADLVEHQRAPDASSNHPVRLLPAPVKAPRSWPNSSLSASSRDSAPQLTGTSGPAGFRPWSCSSRATSSLPVPLSPITSTGAPEGANRIARATSL